jgi:hypothetical protein
MVAAVSAVAFSNWEARIMLELALSPSPFSAEHAAAIRQIQRARMPIAKLGETDPRLAVVHGAWSSRRRGGLLPAWSGADVQDLRPSVDRLQVLECLEARPTAGRFQSVIDVLGDSPTYDVLSGFMDLPLTCPTVDPIVRGLIEDYTNVTFFGSPALHRITVTTADAARAFHRLILPLAADGRQVSMLLVALNAVH